MSGEFEVAAATEMEKRREAAAEFFRLIISPEEQPQLVTDEATVYDISSDDDADLSARCREHYGVSLRREHLSMPIWKLLDYLENVRTIRRYRESDINRIYRRR